MLISAALFMVSLVYYYFCRSMQTTAFCFNEVGKDYDGVTVLDDINLYIRKKEFVTLLGPSGCGKTTTLRIIAGFETPSRGRLLFEGKEINDVPPYKRRVNTVFQKYALFPHLNVFDNIAFGLKLKKQSKDRKAGDRNRKKGI